MDLEDDLLQQGVWTNLAEFALKQVKSAHKICPAISALHGVFWFERWQWPAAGAWGVKDNTCVAADILSDLLPKSVAGEAKKDKAETLLLKLPVGDLSGSFSSSMCSATSNMAETLAKNGHRNIYISTLYWCKREIKFRQIQKNILFGNRIGVALCYAPYGNRVFTFKWLFYYQPVKIPKVYKII